MLCPQHARPSASAELLRVSSARITPSRRSLLVASAAEPTGETAPAPAQGLAPKPPAPQQGPARSKAPTKPHVPMMQKPLAIGGQMLYDYMTGYESQFYEYDYYIDEAWIEGTVPSDLRGTFYSICPGLCQVFGSRVRNPADGDGMVSSFSFADENKIFFRNKFVRTMSFQTEQAAQRRLSRGLHDKGAADGNWLFNPLDLNVRSSANSAVLYWANKLFVLSEHALPHEMNKINLDTLGESTMGGLLAETQHLVGKYKVMRSDGAERVVLMSSQQSGPDAAVRFMELDAGGRLIASTSHRVGGCLARMITDFLVTENYYVLIQSPLSFNATRFMTRYVIGEVSFSECIDFDAEHASRIHLIPRPRPDQAAREQKLTQAPLILDLPPMVSFDMINAYELDGGSIVVADVVSQEGTPFFKDMNTMVTGYFRGAPKPELTRVVANVSKRTASARVISHRSLDAAIVAPSRSGRPHKHLWITGAANEDPQNWGPSQVLTKLNISPTLGLSYPGANTSRLRRASSVTSEQWAPGPKDFLGPPTFVAKGDASNEDDGWILTLLHNADTNKAELIILDASDIVSGPVCSIALPHHLPLSNGGQWVNKYLGPARGAPSRWRPKQQEVRAGDAPQPPQSTPAEQPPSERPL